MFTALGRNPVAYVQITQQWILAAWLNAWAAIQWFWWLSEFVPTSLCGILGFPFRIPPRPPPSLPIPLHCHTQHCPQSVTYPSLTQHCDTTLRRWETVLGWMGATFAWEAWHFLFVRADRICPDLPLRGRCGISTVCWLAAWGGPLGSLRALCTFDFA